MGKTLPILLALTVAGAVGGQTKKFERVPIPQGATQSAKLAYLQVYANSLIAEGVWRADNLNEKTELPFDSVTHLECYKHGGKDIVDADAYCIQMTASVLKNTSEEMPDIDVAYYPVITWDRDKVIAADSSTAPFPICIWTQVTVNLQDHSIMATDTRKLSKGHEGLWNSCKEVPLAQTYHLVDKLEELTRRHLRDDMGCLLSAPQGGDFLETPSSLYASLSTENLTDRLR